MPSPLETSVLGPLSRFGQKPQRAVDGAFTFLAVSVQGGGAAPKSLGSNRFLNGSRSFGPDSSSQPHVSAWMPVLGREPSSSLAD